MLKSFILCIHVYMTYLQYITYIMYFIEQRPSVFSIQSDGSIHPSILSFFSAKNQLLSLPSARHCTSHWGIYKQPNGQIILFPCQREGLRFRRFKCFSLNHKPTSSRVESQIQDYPNSQALCFSLYHPCSFKLSHHFVSLTET